LATKLSVRILALKDVEPLLTLTAAPSEGTQKRMKDMKTKFAAASVFALVLAACGQPEPDPVYIQPSYDKVGNPSCTTGYQLATTEAGQTVCSPVTQ
jgi:hypothetical protein